MSTNKIHIQIDTYIHIYSEESRLTFVNLYPTNSSLFQSICDLN